MPCTIIAGRDGARRAIGTNITMEDPGKREEEIGNMVTVYVDVGERSAAQSSSGCELVPVG